MISTATYQASISGFIKHLSVTASEAEQLLRKAVSVCVAARDNFWQDTSKNRAGKTYLGFCVLSTVYMGCKNGPIPLNGLHLGRWGPSSVMDMKFIGIDIVGN